jgi:hypothetical protein
MPHTEHKVTYGEFRSVVTAVGSVATITNMNPSLLNSFVGIIWYSEPTGVTKAVPTAGTAGIEFLEVATDQFTPALGDPIDATILTDTVDIHANYTQVRITPTGVTGATHYRVVVTANSEDSFPDSVIETSNRGSSGVAIFVQDQTTEALNVPMLSDRGTFTTDGATTRDSRFFDAVAGHGIVVGEIIELGSSTTFMQARAIGIVTNQIEIDSPINSVYISGTVGIRSSDDLRIDGSITPQVFSILPLAGQAGDMVRVIFEIESTTSMDFSSFGDIAALTNGCVLRVKREGGDFRNLFNWKTNGELIERAFDHTFQSKTGGGLHGFVSRITFGGQDKHGVVIRIDGTLGEALEVVIQDDLTAASLSKIRLIAQGHELQG